MPEVNVEINGRKYRMACEEGQEPHLVALADRFNRSIDNLKGAFGEIGDARLTVMAGIAVLDELGEAEKRIASLERDVANLARARRSALRRRPRIWSNALPRSWRRRRARSRRWRARSTIPARAGRSSQPAPARPRAPEGVLSRAGS